MIRYYYKRLRDKKVSVSKTYKQGSIAYVEQPTEAELENIAKMAPVDYQDLKDILDEYEIPRIEAFKQATVLFLRDPNPDKTDQHTRLLMVLLTKTDMYVFSKHKRNLVAKLLEENPGSTTTQQSKLLVLLLLDITRNFTRQVKAIQKVISEKNKTLTNPSTKDIATLVWNEAILNQYLSALVPMRNILKDIQSGKAISIYAQDEALLEDLVIAIDQSLELSKMNLKSLVSLRESLDIISGHKLNQTIKILTLVTILLTIPTVISGIFGMNVPLPWQDNPLGFSYVLSMTLGLMVITMIIFWKNRWF